VAQHNIPQTSQDVTIFKLTKEWFILLS